jgi:hypothetical protein
MHNQCSRKNSPTVALYSAVSMPFSVLPSGEYIVPTAKNGMSDVPWTSQNVPVTRGSN